MAHELSFGMIISRVMIILLYTSEVALRYFLPSGSLSAVLLLRNIAYPASRLLCNIDSVQMLKKTMILVI